MNDRDEEQINTADNIWYDIGNTQRDSTVLCARVDVHCFYEGDRLDLSCPTNTLDGLEMSHAANSCYLNWKKLLSGLTKCSWF